MLYGTVWDTYITQHSSQQPAASLITTVVCRMTSYSSWQRGFGGCWRWKVIINSFSRLFVRSSNKTAFMGTPTHPRGGLLCAEKSPLVVSSIM